MTLGSSHALPSPQRDAGGGAFQICHVSQRQHRRLFIARFLCFGNDSSVVFCWSEEVREETAHRSYSNPVSCTRLNCLTREKYTCHGSQIGGFIRGTEYNPLISHAYSVPPVLQTSYLSSIKDSCELMGVLIMIYIEVYT